MSAGTMHTHSIPERGDKQILVGTGPKSTLGVKDTSAAISQGLCQCCNPVLNIGDVIFASLRFKFSVNDDCIFVDVGDIFLDGLESICDGVFESFLADAEILIASMMRLHGIFLVDIQPGYGAAIGDVIMTSNAYLEKDD